MDKMFNKDFFLKEIARASAKEIADRIKKGEVTMEECKDTGKLSNSKQIEINEILKPWLEAKEKEYATWKYTTEQDSLLLYLSYLEKYPTGKYRAKAHDAIVRLETSQEQEKKRVLADILKNPDNYPPYTLKQYFDRGIITAEDLIQTGKITAQGLNFYFNPPRFVNQHLPGWKNLPQITPDSTDIYFLGITSSGKSCLLAGLLYYANFKRKSLTLIGDNRIGTKYAQDLIRAVDIGFIPPSTPSGEGVNYIATTVKSSTRKNKSHRLNFIEMSGEFFEEVYEDNTGSLSKDELKLTKYLRNKNQKIIFFVVDYKKAAAGYDPDAMADQRTQLEDILTQLEKNGILKEVDAIHLVLTKADLVEGGVQNIEESLKFISHKYGNLMENIRTRAIEHNFKSQYYPFSLGDFMLFETSYQYDPWASERIFDDILKASFFEEKKKPWWKRL